MRGALRHRDTILRGEAKLLATELVACRCTLPADAPLPAPPELRAAAMGAMQQVRRQRQAAGSWSAQDEEDYHVAAMVLSGRWRL